MDVNSIIANRFHWSMDNDDNVISDYVKTQEALFEEIKEKIKPKDISTNSLFDEPDSPIAEGMQNYMMGYLQFHSDAHFFRQSEDTLAVIDGKKMLLVHFDSNGKVEYIETRDENGDYELSEGKYGKTRDEAISKITKLYNGHGVSTQVVNSVVVVNKDNYQLQYKVGGDGVVKNVKRVRDPKDFLGTETPRNIEVEDKDDKKNPFL